MFQKLSRTLLLSAMLLSIGTAVYAQQDTAAKANTGGSISVGTDGISVISNGNESDTAKKKRSFSVQIGMSGPTNDSSTKAKESTRNAKFVVTYGVLDLGFNRIDDKTDYTFSNDLYQFLGPETNSTVGPPPPAKLSSPFKLNEGKSINVNIWIANTRLRIANGERQKLYFTSGIGLQMYNFRFDSRKMYASEPNTQMEFIPSNLDVQKNKLGFTYAAIPLGLLAKTRITEKRWLVYGASITGGYRIASWTKLKTAQRGKEKNHDPFNFSDFNACVMAEVGIEDAVRFYGSYQLTSLSSGPLNQHPFAIGIRFFGL
jgi:hypothetical protein